MNFTSRYQNRIEKTGTRLCIGLDTDPEFVPEHLRDHPKPRLAFNREVIEATADLCAGYKLNLAFYESGGSRGMKEMEETLAAIPPDALVVGDAKRGDLGNTARHYARALFESWNFDAVTVNPYLGTDSMEPFFEYPDGLVFVLGLTSNPGSSQFQRLQLSSAGTDNAGAGSLYMRVIDTCMEAFGDSGQLGFVVGATHPDELGDVRTHTGTNIPLLIPGIGAQGGDVDATVEANAGGVALVNVSRGIIRAGEGESFVEAIRNAAHRFREALARNDPDGAIRTNAPVES
jgi:orotidine-5'-phosphate decarboxylase